MPELWSYSLADFVLFTPRVYFRLIEMRNGALWPAQVVTIGLGLAMAMVLARPNPIRVNATFSILGALWLWLAWSFFWTDYAAINWAAAYFAPVAAFQGILLFFGGRAAVEPGAMRLRDNLSISALGFLVFFVAGYPFIAAAMGRSWFAAEIFGVSPDPTALATMAAIVLTCGRAGWFYMLVPGVWCVISGLTLRAMEVGDFFVAPVCALCAVALMYAKTRN